MGTHKAELTDYKQYLIRKEEINEDNKDKFYSLYIQNMPEKKLETFIPVMELYEYDIVGYPSENRKNSSFGKIIDSPRDSCGKIKIKNYSGTTNNNGVCDSISSQDGGDTYDIDEFYANYQEWQTKIDRNDFPKRLPEKKTNEIKELFEKTKTNMETYVKKISAIEYIYVLDVKPKDKIILFGDHHGSYHTFFRNLLRLHKFGVLNLDTFIINDGYKLIFIGDILDRGAYALEIVYVLCKLIINNNTSENIKILYNRGNHEEKEQAGKDGFKKEIEKKTGSDEIFNLFFDNIIPTFPSAIIINVDNQKRFWVAHGGIPIIINSDFEKNIDIDNNNINITTPIIRIQSKETSIIAYQIRWNDFRHNKYSVLNDGKHGRGENVFLIGKDDAEKFLEINNIDFIIRGHQDSVHNSFFHKNKHFTDATVNNDDITYHYVNGSTKIYGAKARFIPDKQYFRGENIIPVITISTNTDYDRPLVKDSFAVLRFDLNNSSNISFNDDGVNSVFEVLDARKEKDISGILDKIGKSVIADTDKKTIKIKSNMAGTIRITQK